MQDLEAPPVSYLETTKPASKSHSHLEPTQCSHLETTKPFAVVTLIIVAFLIFTVVVDHEQLEHTTEMQDYTMRRMDERIDYLHFLVKKMASLKKTNTEAPYYVAKALESAQRQLESEHDSSGLKQVWYPCAEGQFMIRGSIYDPENPPWCTQAQVRADGLDPVSQPEPEPESEPEPEPEPYWNVTTQLHAFSSQLLSQHQRQDQLDALFATLLETQTQFQQQLDHTSNSTLTSTSTTGSSSTEKAITSLESRMQQLAFHLDEQLTLFHNSSSSVVPGLVGPQGDDGRDGRDGTDGRDGRDGTDGKCVSVLGGSEVWVGGKPLHWGNCGQGWYECSYQQGGETVYRAPGGGVVKAKVGDKLMFGNRGTAYFYNLWVLPNRAAFDSCDFTNATMLSEGKREIRMFARDNGNPAFEFTLAPGHVGTIYFAVNNQHCNGKQLKVAVQVAPMVEIKVGSVSSGSATSETVQRLAGVLQALGRVSVMTQFQHEQRVRAEGGSGLTIVRANKGGLKDYNDPSFSGDCILGIHEHANYLNTLGMGEFGAVLNGVEFTTRHNDYGLSMPHPDPAQHTYSGLAPIPRPDVPPDVLAMPTVALQVAEMQKWLKAFQDQDWSVRDYRPYFKANICVLEGTWLVENGDFEDPFASSRHQIDAASWSELHDKVRYLANSGRKHNLENLAYLPQAVRRMVAAKNGSVHGEDGQAGADGSSSSAAFTLPELANWEYRIVCQPIMGDVPTQRFRVAQDLQAQLFGRPSTKQELQGSRRAHFEVNPKMHKDGTPSYPQESGEEIGWEEGESRWGFLDWMMEQVPGKDGVAANSTDEWGGSIATHYATKKELNVGYYNRYYNVAKRDAMGSTIHRRGFNDGYLWAAKSETFQDKISALSAFDDNVEVFSSWSYAVPLEVVYTTPLHHWNPHGLFNVQNHTNLIPDEAVKLNPKPLYRQDGIRNANPVYSSEDLVHGKHEMAAGSLSKPRDGKPVLDPLTGAASCDPSTAYNGISETGLFFQTPAELFADEEADADADAADTSVGCVCVLDAATGQTHRTKAAGVYISLPSIGGGVGAVRTRFPIAPLHVQGSTSWKEVKALEELTLSKDYEALNGESHFGDSRDEVYGLVLELKGGSHTHLVPVKPDHVTQWESTGTAELELSSERANAHEHIIRVSRSRPSTHDPWRYDVQACKFKGADTWDEGGSCADGHTMVARR